jgi:hypothetical protein
MAASRRGVDALTVVEDVDVDEDVPMMASYDLPRLKSDVTFDASLIVANPDRVVDGAAGLANYVVHTYERELRRRIVASKLANYVGLRVALPESVGLRRVGEIDEVEFPGWRSQSVSGVVDAYSGLVILDSLCSRGMKFPDLTIVDPKTYSEVASRFQTQQRFWTVVGGTPMLAFMGGSLYPEAQAESRTAFTVHSSDFVFHHTPVQVSVALAANGYMTVEVTGREQLYPVRRYRSGTLNFDEANSVENFQPYRRSRSTPSRRRRRLSD